MKQRLDQRIANARGREARRLGFTLIEAVVALVVISVIASLLAPVWISGVRGSVEGSARLAATHQLRSELEAWSLQAASLPFEDLPAEAAAYFGAIGDIDLIDSQWVEFLDPGGNQRTEVNSIEATDHLRITVRHTTTGQVLTRIHSKVSP